jgi:hypothetical protein
MKVVNVKMNLNEKKKQRAVETALRKNKEEVVGRGG